MDLILVDFTSKIPDMYNLGDQKITIAKVIISTVVLKTKEYTRKLKLLMKFVFYRF